MLDLVKHYIVDVWNINSTVPISDFIWESVGGGGGGVRNGGRLRRLHGKADTTISRVCTCTVSSAQCSGSVVYGHSAMAAV